ncbi:MAG: hypothetical protein PWQ88_255 [Candidatus Methanomethylophilaceae archaeon]|nr:hypothetical protein [Candidatus Methanomethylophilaceae archaeon]MDI3542060.1 hypothetical protein [Candidatus Methanomethylophilaceae archaeon]HIJ00814.1 hypothetical protein [Candidatus Methanomethylophilaceae archaeon]
MEFFDIGQIIYDIFGPYGWWGILLCVLLIFIIDSMIFPTLPELFTVIAFMYSPSLEWALAILLTLVVGEFLGMTTLFLIVERIHVPKKIQMIASRYVNFLIIGDEKILLVNRIAPMIPFAGAFVSIIDSWTYRKAVFYLATGAALKYGVILAMSGFFYTVFSGPTAQRITLTFVISIIIISFLFSYYKKKNRKEGKTNEDSAC